MMKYIVLLASLSILFCADAGAQRSRKKKTARHRAAEPAGITYLRAVPGGKTQDISWIYVGRDGTIIKDPKYGVDPVDIAQERKHNAGKTGTYTISGNKMMINWENGKTAEWTIERQGNQLVSIDGAIVGKQSPMPDDYRITGQYSAELILPSVSSGTTIAFDKDGTFSQTSFGGVNTASGSAVSQDMSEGSYRITGNTLRLNYTNGSKVISMITVWTLRDGKTYLIINGSSFPQK